MVSRGARDRGASLRIATAVLLTSLTVAGGLAPAARARTGASSASDPRSASAASGVSRARRPGDADGGARRAGTEARPRTPLAALSAASNEFAFGRYERVVRLLRPVVERGALPRGGDQVEALRLYGICLYLTGRQAAALRIFRVLVEEEPSLRLDPRLVQPEVVAAFERVRRAKLRSLRRQVRRKLDRRYGVLNLLPPAGQFQNGQWRKAVVILSLEVGLLAANLGSYFALKSEGLQQSDHTFVERDLAGNVVEDHRPLAKALIGINIASLALLLGTLVYGMVDGYIYYAKGNKRLMRVLEQPVTLRTGMPGRSAGVGVTYRF